MLGVTFTSGEVLQDTDSRRKKDKKEKKKKKEKRDKKEKRAKKRAGSDSNDSSSEESDGRRRHESGGHPPEPADATLSPETQAANEVQQPALQREDWMTKPMQRPTAPPSQEELEEQERQKAAAAEPEIVSGLRMMKKTDSAQQQTTPSEPAAVTIAGRGAASGGGGGGGGPLVGDGGVSWRLKALRRAQEQAKAEGRSLEQVVGERWGSLAQLTQGLSSSAAADGRAHLRAAAERRRAGPAGGAEGGAAAALPHYLQDVRSDSARMMRPAEDASLRWHRDRPVGHRREDRPTGQREGRPSGDRDAAAAREGDRAREGAGKDRERGLPRRDEGRGRADSGYDRERRNQDDGERDRGREREKDRQMDRNRNREGEREAERVREREHDRTRDRDRLPGRGHDGEGGSRGRREGEQSSGPRPSREQAALLQQLAPSLNNFKDDGSFMDRFLAARGGQSTAGQPREQLSGRERVRAGDDGAGGSHDDVNHDHDHDGDDEGRGGRVAIKSESPSGRAPSPKREHGDGKEEDGGPSKGGGGATAGGGNRAIAAALRARSAGGPGVSAAAAVGGEPGNGGDGEGDGAVARAGGSTATVAAPRRAPLFVGRGDQDADNGGGGSTRPPAAAAPISPQPPPAANKSAAELLRARLRGLPPPPASTAPAAVGVVEGGAGADSAPSTGAGAGPSVKREQSDDYENDNDGDGGSGGGGGSRSRREVVQLPLVDASGRAVRGAFGREAAGAGAEGLGRRAGTKAPQRYNLKTGEKERYFADDDKVDLQTMLRRAKYGDDDMDMDAHLATNIAKKRKFRETDLDVDAEYDFDGGLEMYDSRRKRGNAEGQRSRERNRQVAEVRRVAAAEASCMLCLNNPQRPAHLTVAVGTRTHLSLPARGRLVRGHSVIVPAEHSASMRSVDDATWTEVKNFVKCLIMMHGAQGQSVLFMETYMPRNGPRHHAVLDAVPVTERQLEKARGYFKKAILEAESEWSTHHAKACIETTAQKGLRESIPPNFPYFYVQFGYGAGYVHVIDNETKFDPNFGRQVLIGLLDLPPELSFQRQKAESVATQQQWRRDFESQWQPYDWTKQLEE